MKNRTLPFFSIITYSFWNIPQFLWAVYFMKVTTKVLTKEATRAIKTKLNATLCKITCYSLLVVPWIIISFHFAILVTWNPLDTTYITEINELLHKIYWLYIPHHAPTNLNRFHMQNIFSNKSVPKGLCSFLRRNSFFESRDSLPRRLHFLT